MKNPLKLLINSINSILMLPFELLKEVGLLSSKFFYKISNNILTRFITAISTLLSIISAVVSVVIGWDAFIKIVKSFFDSLFS